MVRFSVTWRTFGIFQLFSCPFRKIKNMKLEECILWAKKLTFFIHLCEEASETFQIKYLPYSIMKNKMIQRISKIFPITMGYEIYGVGWEALDVNIINVEISSAQLLMVIMFKFTLFISAWRWNYWKTTQKPVAQSDISPRIQYFG